MSINIEKSGTDLASLLAPLESGWPQVAVTNVKHAGADLNTIFAPAASGTPAGNVNIHASGTDIGPKFAAIGTTTVQAVASTYSLTYSGSSEGAAETTNSTTITASKGKQSGYMYSWTLVNNNGTGTLNGTGTATVSVTSSPPVNTTYNGTLSCLVSDGTSSTTVSGITWSVADTSPSNILAMNAQSTFYDGQTLVGYSSAPSLTFGSLSPATLAGYVVYELYVKSVVLQLQLTLIGASSQSVFTSISFTDNEGTRRTYTSASASFVGGGGYGNWYWNVPYVEFTSGNNYSITVVI